MLWRRAIWRNVFIGFKKPVESCTYNRSCRYTRAVFIPIESAHPNSRLMAVVSKVAACHISSWLMAVLGKPIRK